MGGAGAEEGEVDVVVVGGGIAGIASALQLARRGLEVVMVESRSILGGRARSWVDGTTRDPVHIGPHVVVSQYPNYFRLLELLGTRHRIVWQPRRHFLTWVRGGARHDIRTQALPAPASWARASWTDPFARYADKHSTVPAAVHCLSLSDDEVMALDTESGAEFLARMGVTPAYVQHFWGFLAHAILNVPIEEVSAAALVSFFRQLIGHSSMEMGFSDGGLGDLLAPARDILAGLGCRILMNTEVTRFLGDDRCTGVELDDGRRLMARRGVVNTLPPHTLLPLLPREWLQQHASIAALERLKPCMYYSVYIWFDRKISGGRQMWARTYSRNDLNCEFYDFSEIYSGVDSKGVPWKERPSFVGSNVIDAGRVGEMTDEEIVQRTLDEMLETYDAVREARVLHSVVNRVPMAIHRPVVGTESLRPGQASPVEGLYFAGCWTKTGFPSSMESAARAGFLAAERLLEHAGVADGPIAVPYGEIELGARLVGKLDALRPALLAPLFRALVWLSGGPSPPPARSRL